MRGETRKAKAKKTMRKGTGRGSLTTNRGSPTEARECAPHREAHRSTRNESGAKWTVYMFTASWCKPCKAVYPIWEQLKKDYTSIQFHKIDIDAKFDMAEAADVKSVPTFTVCGPWDDGAEVQRWVGASCELLISAVQKLDENTRRG